MSTSLVLLDAGVFLGALMEDDARHQVAARIVDAARHGNLPACTTTGILSEVYATLTWSGSHLPASPEEAAEAIRLLVEPAAAIAILADGEAATQLMLSLAAQHNLTARRIHDARHAATAIVSGVTQCCTYDLDDWRLFEKNGLTIVQPEALAQS